ncbi:MAG TPA: phosphotransferase [Chloroflexia bacterium]|jgi:Ser/Thr protein kinase RdoA (MazF antagonist)
MTAEGTSFEHLSRRVQIARLRKLAGVALEAYDLGALRLTLLAHLFNTTFRVDTDTGQRYVLRIHRAGTPTVESVNAELAWLHALRRDTTLEVPDPVPTRTGTLLTVAAITSVPTPHICVLFRWLNGRQVDAGLKPTHLERTGALMARLQDHAAQFGPPPGFARGRVDYPVEMARNLPDPFSLAVINYCRTLVADTLSEQEAEQVTAVIEWVHLAEQALGISEGERPPTFGLIHADLHQYNLIFSRGTVRAIDFDDCGFGPLLYDLAVPLTMLQGRAEYPALRAALLRGYRRVRPLSDEHEAYLDTFIALRHLQDALWVLEYRKHPVIRDDWDAPAQARRSLARVTAFLAAGGRFPDPT